MNQKNYDWEVAGVLVNMGEEIARLCNEYNKDFELYGIKSTEPKVDRLLIRQSINMLKCFTGFDVKITKYYLYYSKVEIVYKGDVCGLPWHIKHPEVSYEC